MESLNGGVWVQRDALTVKNTWWSCRGLRYGSQHSHGDSLPPVIPVPGDMALPSDLCGH